jgi:hypothetical protein
VVFGAWKFHQVHKAENNVASLQSEIATLNAQVPKYDLVVAANNAYSAGLARRASVLDSAVDWPVVFNNLVAITPADAQVQTFVGTQLPPKGSATAGASTAASAAGGAASTSGSSQPVSKSIGTVQLGVTGPGPALTISEAWINAVSSSQLFANPLQGATTANPDGTISFPFAVSITPNASLSENASLK